ncbi:MAG: DUF4118 domain-containing protein [Chitinophagaceae bacterium]
MADTLRLAEGLGGEAVTVPSVTGRIADDALDYAHAHNVTQIVVGKSSRSKWFELIYGSVVHDLVRGAGNLGVHVIPGEESSEEPVRRKFAEASGPTPQDATPYAIALAAVGVALGAGIVIHPFLGVENVDLILLAAIVGIAVRYGLWPSLLAVVAASLCYNFFLPAAVLYLHHHGSQQCRGLRLLHRDGCRDFERGGAGARAGASSQPSAPAPTRRSTRSAASSQGLARSMTCCGPRPIRRR